MARYNRWMNERLYECCARLSDEERKKDAGAFFKSIHGTLNHLLLGDRIWMGRFTGKPFPVASLAQELYAGFSELRSERIATDNAAAVPVVVCRLAFLQPPDAPSWAADDVAVAAWNRSGCNGLDLAA